MDKKTYFFFLAFIVIGILTRIIFQYKGIGISTIAKTLRKKSWEFVWISMLSLALFLYIPHFFFDDAGFILRHLDHFAKGYLFRYNMNDPAVYGVSGFIHGAFTGILCWLHLTTSEQALYVSNLMGFILASYFAWLIIKALVKDYWLAILIWILTISFSKMYLNVASCGLETPLHFTFVLAAIYFLISNKTRRFFLFTAFMIVSKLDAVPVAGTLLLFYLILKNPHFKRPGFFKSTLKKFILYFIIPLAISLIAITLIFGSPLPQSAFAKIYYHSHSKDFWFPFLEYFINSKLRIFLLCCFSIVMILHLAEIIIKKNIQLVIHALFGWIFISIMTLYYFYNPGERMMWYYAMPELFFMFQIVYSLYFFIQGYFKWKGKSIVLIGIWAFVASFVWTDVYNSFHWLRSSVQVIENERTKIGIQLGEMSKPDEILLSGHGLFARPFKGYVMDMSGLNSKKATNYHLKPHLIIAAIQPDYIINNASPILVNQFNQFNYQLIGIYRDITIQGYSSWILLKKQSSGQTQHNIGLWNPSFTQSPQIKLGDVYSMVYSSKDIVIHDNYIANQKILHIGLDRTEQDWELTTIDYRNGKETSRKTYMVPALGEDSSSPSQVIFNLALNISDVDSVAFSSNRNDFKLIEPIYELINTK